MLPCDLKEEEQSSISFPSRAVFASGTIVSYRVRARLFPPPSPLLVSFHTSNVGLFPSTLDYVDSPVQRVAKCTLNRHTKENGQWTALYCYAFFSCRPVIILSSGPGPGARAWNSCVCTHQRKLNFEGQQAWVRARVLERPRMPH